MSHNRPYDSGESRRSPRDRSPGRRTDSRDGGRYNGGYPRDNEPQQRSSSISRNSSNSFARDDFRDGPSRGELFPNRDPPRDIPRGPKALFDSQGSSREPNNIRDPPSGPRVNNYANDFRGRGGRGGRGRGYYDDRDRSQPDRSDYRDRRDDRPFRDDRSDRGRYTDVRDRRDSSFRGGRRSPPPPAAAYRGRGRGTEDFRRYRGRSRSPDPYDRSARRTSMVSPPPAVVDVPAFGALAPAEIPTGPRATTTNASRGRGSAQTPAWRGSQPLSETSITVTPVATSTPRPRTSSPGTPSGPASTESLSNTQNSPGRERSRPIPPPPLLPSERRRLEHLKEIGAQDGQLKLGPTRLQRALRKPIQLDDQSESESEDEDELDVNYFEGELAKAQHELDELKAYRRAHRGPSPDTMIEIMALIEAEEEAKRIKSPMLPAQTQQSAPVQAQEPESNETIPPTTIVPLQNSVADDSNSASLQITPSVEMTGGVEMVLSRVEKGKDRIDDAEAAIDRLAIDAPPGSELAEDAATAQKPQRKVLNLIELPDYSDLDDLDDLSEAEYEAELASTRAHIKTPDLSSLPYGPDPIPADSATGTNGFTTDSAACVSDMWNNNLAISGAPKPLAMQAMMVKMMQMQQAERNEEILMQETAAQVWKKNYKEWLLLHRSDDPDAVANRARWERKKAAKMPPIGRTTPLPEARPEGRRNASKYATARDLDAVIEQSKLAYEENLEKTKLEKKELAASKEAKVPDMYTARERQVHMFNDTSGLVTPERAVSTFEVVPVDLKFTEEEFQIFMQAIRRTPKKFVKIAEHLPGRTYKDCIQFYYQIKHAYDIRSMIEEVQSRKKPGPKAKRGAKPKASALTANLRPNDADDNEGDGNGEAKPKSPRPRRAAAPVNFDKNANRSDIETTAAPPATARKPRTKQQEPGAEPKTSKRRVKGEKTEKAKKQPKNGQAGTPASASRAASKTRDEKQPKSYTPVPPPQPLVTFNPPWQAPPQQTNYERTMPEQYYPQTATAPPSTVQVPEMVAQPYLPERIESIPPQHAAFDSQQPQRGLGTQTSSYWSVPEVTDFPQLLAHFGTDWTAISKHMQSKTLIMVYTTVFQPWLIMPKDSNKSRRVTNLEKQVKNYYQRQVEGGKNEWERIAVEADAKRARGESMGPPPNPTMPAATKRTPQRPPGMNIDGMEDHAQAVNINMQPNLAARTETPPFTQGPRYQTLAQAGPPSASAKLSTTESGSTKHVVPQQQSLQAQSRTAQVASNKAPRGPALGFFEADRTRPILKASSNPHTPQRPHIPSKELNRSERSIMVAREAEMEQAQALQQLEQQRMDQQRIEQQRAAEQRAEQQRLEMQRQDQRQHMEQQRIEQQRILEQQRAEQQRLEQQRIEQHQARQRQLKQESEAQSMNQYEQYSTQTQQPNVMAPSRHDPTRPQEPARHQVPSRHEPSSYRVDPGPVPYRYDDRFERGPESGRQASSIQPYGAREAQPHRGAAQEPNQTTTSTPSARSALSATPVRHEPSRPPPAAQAPVLAAVRQQDTARKTSNIMSLLNDEPTESRQTQSKPATPLMQPSNSPAVRESMYQAPPPRQHSGSGPPQYQPPGHHQQQSQSSPYSIPPQPHRPQMMQQQPQHTSAPPPQHTYGQPQASHQLHQTQSSGPPSRSYTPSHYEPPGYVAPAPQLRRESSLGDIHSHHRGVPSGSHSGSQAGMRHPLNESPYSAASNPVSRQQAASPLGRHTMETNYGRGPAAQAGYISTQPPPQQYQDPRGYQDMRGAPPTGPAGYVSQQRQEQERLQQMAAEQQRRGPGPSHGAPYSYEERRMQEERDRQVQYERDRAYGGAGGDDRARHAQSQAHILAQQQRDQEEEAYRRRLMEQQQREIEMMEMDRRRGGR